MLLGSLKLFYYIYLNNINMNKSKTFKLSDEQLKLCESEYTLRAIMMGKNYRAISTKIWNKYKINVWLTFSKDGELIKADQDGWGF